MNHTFVVKFYDAIGQVRFESTPTCCEQCLGAAFEWIKQYAKTELERHKDVYPVVKASVELDPEIQRVLNQIPFAIL